MRACAKRERTERFWTRRVNYQWTTPCGTVMHGNTVVLALSRPKLKESLRRFWQTNQHVSPEVEV